jgi:hypothetical protein
MDVNSMSTGYPATSANGGSPGVPIYMTVGIPMSDGSWTGVSLELTITKAVGLASNYAGFDTIAAALEGFYGPIAPSGTLYPLRPDGVANGNTAIAPGGSISGLTVTMPQTIALEIQRVSDVWYFFVNGTQIGSGVASSIGNVNAHGTPLIVSAPYFAQTSVAAYQTLWGYFYTNNVGFQFWEDDTECHEV